MFSIKNGKVSTLAKRVKTSPPVNVELKLLLDLISDTPENLFAKLLGVVWNFRFILDGVFVDTLNSSLVKVDLEVVGVQLKLSASSLGVSGWSLWEESK
jgi:hypothetical protein